MTSLIVQIDNVAYLRNIAGGELPEPSHCAVLAQIAGAGGVACHLRQDRMHITDRDLYILREVVKSKLVLKIFPDHDLIERALEVRPDLTILMPEETADAKTTIGIDFSANAAKYSETAERLKSGDLAVGYFIDPDESSVKEAARSKVDLVELNALDYLNSRHSDDADSEWERLEYMGQLAAKLGLQVACSNRLDYGNLSDLRELDLFRYLSIGGAIVNKAVLTGFEGAVRDAIEAMRQIDQ